MAERQNTVSDANAHTNKCHVLCEGTIDQIDSIRDKKRSRTRSHVRTFSRSQNAVRAEPLEFLEVVHKRANVRAQEDGDGDVL